MADLETFRTEAAAWLDANAPLEIRGLELDPDTGGAGAGAARPLIRPS